MTGCGKGLEASECQQLLDRLWSCCGRRRPKSSAGEILRGSKSSQKADVTQRSRVRERVSRRVLRLRDGPNRCKSLGAVLALGRRRNVQRFRWWGCRRSPLADPSVAALGTPGFMPKSTGRRSSFIASPPGGQPWVVQDRASRRDPDFTGGREYGRSEEARTPFSIRGTESKNIFLRGSRRSR